ncbi:Macrolide export protein MacA [Acaryochloris thomasi RCC1774]|uniref:Macrolide export protein MacA n=1 Tax=Acaryochloris thomasi RCC1774 TaxID=1764569 RepID=A0A2W1JLC1_9CYAN|nr:efflux RND transporter periplasmic adaptor subunit [Acaryochloris thomasi]PZD74180.1 Macrolide export protein MacA [Acaryochloris thomasi RCC1774]
MGDKPLLKPPGKWIVGGAILVALTTAAVGIARVAQLQPGEEASAEGQQASETGGRLVTALGRVEPEGEIIKIGAPAGERILRMLVQDGQEVKQGQAIAYLESYPEQLAERDLAKSQLQEAKALLASEQQLGQVQVQEAQTRQAQVSQPKAEQMRAQAATVERLKAELTLAQKDYQRFQYLQERGAISAKELDDRALALRSRQEELNNAAATFAQLRQQLQTDFANATTQVDMARAGTIKSQVQTQVASRIRELEVANARLARTIIAAPQNGQILKVLLREGEAVPLGGSQGGSDGDPTIVEMGNTSRMVVVAEVYETDIRHVKVGQSAMVTSPAFDGELYGVVKQVGLRIGKNDVLDTDPAANTDSRVIEVKIGLANGSPVAQLTNLQVDVVIRPQG